MAALPKPSATKRKSNPMHKCTAGQAVNAAQMGNPSSNYNVLAMQQRTATIAALKHDIIFFGTRDAATEGRLVFDPLQPLNIEGDDLAVIFNPNPKTYVAQMAERLYDLLQHPYYEPPMEDADKAAKHHKSQDQHLRWIKEYMSTERGRQCAAVATTLLVEEVIQVHEHGILRSVIDGVNVSYRPNLKTRFSARLELVQQAVQNNKIVT